MKPSSQAAFGWLRQAPPQARRALLAASLGWALDSFDVMLFALLAAPLMADLHLGKAAFGAVGSLTLVSAAAGGLVFGVIADRYGRTRALMGSVLLYAVFTAACGLAQGFVTLAVFRILLGFGMGGEWAAGAALVSETWPDEHRGKALALVQSSWAIGYAAAALVAFLVLPIAGWRAVFFVGILPALLALWLRRGVEESHAWKVRAGSPAASVRSLFRRPLLRSTLALTAMNASCLFAWWGFNSWVPGYLSLPVGKGGIGFQSGTMTGIVVLMQVGMWFGYVCFGYLADRFGRKRVYVAYLLSATMLLLLFAATRSPVALLALGPLVAFAATGYFSGFAAVTAETYPTPIRATAQGLTYNTGRLLSAAAPLFAGTLAERHGFAAAFQLDAGAFALAALLWVLIPETRRLAATRQELGRG